MKMILENEVVEKIMLLENVKNKKKNMPLK